MEEVQAQQKSILDALLGIAGKAVDNITAKNQQQNQPAVQTESAWNWKKIGLIAAAILVAVIVLKKLL